MIWQALIGLAMLAVVGAAGFLAGVVWAGHEVEPDWWDTEHPYD